MKTTYSINTGCTDIVSVVGRNLPGSPGRSRRRAAIFPLPSERRGNEGEGCSAAVATFEICFPGDALTPQPGPLPSEGRGKTRAAFRRCWRVAFSIALLTAALPKEASAHCDTLDGPVVAAARQALASNDVNRVLIWVQKNDEAEIKKVFEKTVAVRKLNAEARDLADMYFFETLVRIHRAGEGAPYTGLKPAGTDLGAAVPAADKAIADGKLEPLATLLTGALHEGLHKKFEQIKARRNYAKDDVEAGRKYVAAYVEFVHYVEGVHSAAGGEGTEHSQEAATPAAHEHR